MSRLAQMIAAAEALPTAPLRQAALAEAGASRLPGVASLRPRLARRAAAIDRGASAYAGPAAGQAGRHPRPASRAVTRAEWRAETRAARGCASAGLVPSPPSADARRWLPPSERRRILRTAGAASCPIIVEPGSGRPPVDVGERSRSNRWRSTASTRRVVVGERWVSAAAKAAALLGVA